MRKSEIDALGLLQDATCIAPFVVVVGGVPTRIIAGPTSRGRVFQRYRVVDPRINNGPLTVEVRMKPEEGDLCRNFIPKTLYSSTCCSYSRMRK